MSRFGSLGQQYFDDTGEPLLDGKIFFYESGTTTPKDTFADVNLSIANPNPVLLTGSGRQPNIFFNGTAKAILTDQDEVQIEVRDPVGDTGVAGQFNPWNSLTIYNQPDIVVGSDDNFYLSITDGNQGNDPTTSPANWLQVKFVGVYNANVVFSMNDIVQASNGLLYVSKINGNQGNNPLTSLSEWGPASDSADTSGPSLSFYFGTM